MGSKPRRRSRSLTTPKSLAAEGNEGTAAGATPSAARLEARDAEEESSQPGAVLGTAVRGGDRADFRVDEVAVQPVARPPRLRLVNPVARGIKKSGSTRQKRVKVQPVAQRRNARSINDLHPPTVPGCTWKPSGLSGWELYSRAPAISANGKRSSKHKYLAYYSKEAVKRFYDEQEKAANARRA